MSEVDEEEVEGLRKLIAWIYFYYKEELALICDEECFMEEVYNDVVSRYGRLG